MNRRHVAIWFAAGFWALFGLISGIQVWISMIAHGHSVPRLILYHVAVWEAWIIPTMAIVWLARRQPLIPPRRFAVLVHLLASCVIGALHSLYWLGITVLLRPYDRMTIVPHLSDVPGYLFERSSIEWILYCLVLGAAMAFDYSERYRERALQAVQLEASLADARLHALELQIQPHFLFNTMNAISSLVRMKRNDEAVAMMAGLSELLRYTLDHAGRQEVALEEELAILQRYLEIQQFRFPDRMTFTIDLAPSARRAAVPALLLQPLAENAVRHGIATSASPGSVEVRAFREGGVLTIEVFNSGALRVPSAEGIGVRNTRERIQHLYGSEGRFELASGEGGVVASLTIPWSEVA